MEQYVFCGYPSDHANGSVLHFSELFAINANSKQKSGAWAFLSYLMTQPCQEEMHLRLPVNDSVLQTQLAGRLEDETITQHEIDMFYQMVDGLQAADYENCSGTKRSDTMVDTSREDILDAIADAYLNVGCAVMTPDSKRMQRLQDLVRQFHADGVMDLSLQACQPYLLETAAIRSLCQELKIPYIALETDYSTADSGQLDTRIAAFLETLEQ